MHCSPRDILKRFNSKTWQGFEKEHLMYQSHNMQSFSADIQVLHLLQLETNTYMTPPYELLMACL